MICLENGGEHASAPRPRAELPGLDLARILAALLVFWTHCCAISGQADPRWGAGFRMGALGTTLFFGLSAFFAARSIQNPNAWLISRLRTLLPAYWLVLTASFILTWATGHKSFDALQVVCQFAGIGHYTHADRLVNVTTWFISQLLVLYFLVYAARATSPRLVLALAGWAFVCGSLWPGHAYQQLCWQGLTFVCVYLLASSRKPPWASFLILSGGFLALSLGLRAYLHAAVAMAIMGLCCLPLPELRWARWFRGYGYEWFLVHGLCLNLVARLVTSDLLGLAVLGLALSLLAMLSLHRTVRAIVLPAITAPLTLLPRAAGDIAQLKRELDPPQPTSVN